MQDTKIIGDSGKERRIDYDLIERINRQAEIEAKKRRLEKIIRKKKGIDEEKEEEPANDAPSPADNTNYITTPDELRDIKGNYSLHRGLYLIDFDIHVPNGNSLILNPGVQLHFTKDAGITCEGRFEARGEDGLEVLLTAKDKKEGWKNLYLKGEAKAVLDYAMFSYGKGRNNKYGCKSGGAVLLKGEGILKSQITINNSCFENNSAEYAGAIFSHHAETIIQQDNRFKNNSAKYGGAIYNNQHGKTIIQENNIFENNSAKGYGGAIYNNQHGKTIIQKNNRFENNSAKGYGGAIYNYQHGRIIIQTNNIFENNNAAKGYGGAIYNCKGDLIIIENNIFEKNSARLQGGAIRNYQGRLEIDKLRNVFISNTPDDIYKE